MTSGERTGSFAGGMVGRLESAKRTRSAISLNLTRNGIILTETGVPHWAWPVAGFVQTGHV